MCLLGSVDVMTIVQQSHPDQQISLRKRWSPKTSIRGAFRQAERNERINFWCTDLRTDEEMIKVNAHTMLFLPLIRAKDRGDQYSA